MVVIMYGLTDMEYLDHIVPRICSVCRNLNPALLSSIMSKSCHRIFNKNNTPHATIEEETAYRFGESEFTTVLFSIISFLCSSLWINVCLYVPFFRTCIVCPFSIYGFCLHLWYLQTFFVVVILLNMMYALLANV